MDELRVFLKVKGSQMQAIRPEIVESLPRNPAGMVLKRDLRKQDS